jgi:hypothetical protein
MSVLRTGRGSLRLQNQPRWGIHRGKPGGAPSGGTGGSGGTSGGTGGSGGTSGGTGGSGTTGGTGGGGTKKVAIGQPSQLGAPGILMQTPDAEHANLAEVDERTAKQTFKP